MNDSLQSEMEIVNELNCDKEQIGYKVFCHACSGMFYDLNAKDPVCPYCKTLYSKASKKQIKTAIKPTVDLTIVDDDSTDSDNEFLISE